MTQEIMIQTMWVGNHEKIVGFQVDGQSFDADNTKQVLAAFAHKINQIIVSQNEKQK